MENKKNEKINYDELLISMLNMLLFENQILRKKQNNEKLSEKEKIFDKYILPPSIVLKIIAKEGKKENK